MLSTLVNRLAPSATLAMSQKSAELKAQGVDVINLSVGEPDFNTPDHIKEAAKKAVDDNFSRYSPVAGYPALRKAIVEKLKNENGLDYAPEQIVCSNGAKQCVCNAVMALVSPGEEVIIPAPYWVSYPQMVLMADGKPVFVEAPIEQDFKITPEQLEAAITPKTKALILCSPSNPTGSVYSAAELEALAAVLRRHPQVWVISDEIYEKLIYDGRKHLSIAQLGEQIKAQTFLVNGMSKAYAMTGWRIGYVAGPRHEITAMANFQSQATSNANTIAQYAAMKALQGDQSCVDEMVKEFEKRRDLMVERINAIPGISCRKPQGAFYIMMNIKQLLGRTYNGRVLESSMDFAELLLAEKQVAVVPGVAFEAEGYCRLSYAVSADQINRGLDRIEEFVRTLG